MATNFKQGGAQALPIARAFLATGGRLSIDPHGKLDAGGALDWMTAEDARQTRRSFTVCRRFFRRMRNEHFARSVKCLVVQEGQRTEHGWFVMDAAPPTNSRRSLSL